MRLSLLTLLAAVSLLAACNPTKRLPAGERLYVGADISAQTAESSSDRKALVAELKTLPRPRPNKNLLGFRPGLFFYNLIPDTPKRRGIRGFLKRKYGEEPVLASTVNLEKNRQVMVNRMENRGFFQAAMTAEMDTSSKDRMAKAIYKAVTGPRYRIRNVVYPDDSSRFSKILRQVSPRSALKPGDPYSLDRITAERDRIDRVLKNRGYYYFNPEYLIVEVDSTVGDRQVDLFVQVKEDAPFKGLIQYRVRNITMYPNFDISEGIRGDTAGDVKDAVITPEGYRIVDPTNRFKPSVFSRSLIFTPYERYNRRDHNTSLNRLVSLGTFKFVKVEFDEADTLGFYLDANYYATPVPKKSLRAEITGLTRSNNATGSELAVSWRNRNFLRGAELFTLTAFLGLESQVYGTQPVATIRYGGEANLYVPRTISPFKLRTKGNFVPQTRFSLGYEHFYRNDQYSLNSFTAQYGYQWKSSITRENNLTLLNINLVDSSNVSDSFRRLIAINPTLRRSITRQFILGSIYNYNYNTNARPNRKTHNFFFNGNIDGSGNLIGLFTGTTLGSRTEPFTIAGVPISQYIRLELEGRHYWRLNKVGNPARDITLASRLLAGAGYAYGNSTEMPFIKQFFAGGANSIRAFRARSVGPGTYDGNTLITTTEGATVFLADQPGDIRFEANSEIRFPIIAILKGAAFVDAGNVWTMRDDPVRPGSKFTGNFLSQLAIGAGLGLRADLSFLVVRLDLATPLRKPWELAPNATVNPAAQRQNIVANIAIGYPF